MTYQLLDCGDQKKLERFGDYLLIRPAAAALWKPALPEKEWKEADAVFSREGGNQWRFRRKLPSSWTVKVGGLKLKISPTDFGHLGLFPEHFGQCQWVSKCIKAQKQAPNVLNLFAYSGMATLAAAQAGAEVCHLDASRGMVSWARENAQLSSLDQAPIRWIVDDVFKFLKREVRRNATYDGIILDPPSFGRGASGESFKIERDIGELLRLCRSVLSSRPLFVIFSSHSQGMTPLVMKQLLSQMMDGAGGKIEEGEMVIKLDFAPFLTAGFRRGGFQVGINFEGRVKSTLPEKLNSRWAPLSRKMTSKKLQSRVKGKEGFVLPSGTYARWKQ